MIEATKDLGFIKESETRAILYNIFAAVMARKLDESWLNPHFQGQLNSGLPDVEGKEELLSSLSQAADKPGYFKEVQLDYDALFIVPGTKLIFPYESCYTHRNIDGTFGRLWQEPAQNMYRILKEWEIQFAEGWDLIPDHIAIELSFMGNLCQLVTARQANEEERQRLLEWQKKILANHLSLWVYELLDNMENKAETAFYRGVAKLLRAFLREEETFVNTFN
ncbi:MULTISPECIES: molecular chaperone TorD family protein [unclassified Desulfosporosinus]|uniref:TorD/DmsD family molecular chaperone n=1 Tax=unclassified Desulfosporosinus TaxID=2633794 RepID=UPI000B49B164|nr:MULTISPECIES: molecular chaperone TorD family protein [unclassified Desulfosporosinus]